MASALDVARYLVELASRESVPEGLTNSRLQPLLYYAQGWHLGSFDRPLFAEPITVGPNGPIIAEAFATIEAAVGADPLRVIRPGELGPCGLSFRDQQFVAAIWEKYRGYSALGLRALLLEERSWVAPGAGKPQDGAGEMEAAPAVLRMYFLRRDELRNFDPAEWERVTEGEASLARGEGIPWSEVKRRLRERRLSTPVQPAGS